MDMRRIQPRRPDHLIKRGLQVVLEFKNEIYTSGNS
jgi:hypothetical protein